MQGDFTLFELFTGLLDSHDLIVAKLSLSDSSIRVF